ncbi:Uncharacterized protein TCM_038869 [Theobroma cacao]|uniref:Retrotransposon Copia-like N-terminal domain-containing protein n=1 Tax=Theobroma cacao TaxID=3641 RepID=A0A061GQH0_THECC|nr:Uncharacterized protein TCM_038869 [Theobroma cacao]
MVNRGDEEADKGNGNLVLTIVTSNNTVVDIKSPYYLHSSDHLGLIFVTHPLSETGENYFTWRCNFMNALQSKNKARFVDGSIPKLEISSPEFRDWVQCNAMILSWFINALSKELLAGAVHAKTTNEI